MVHSLTPPLVPAATATSTVTTSASSQKKKIASPSLGFQRVLRAYHQQQAAHQTPHPPTVIDRRSISLGLAGLVLGLNTGSQSANAAGKRAPPPPPAEKKDPSVTGVLAKVLASRKRKEALKEAAAKLREKGKPVNNVASE